MFFSGKMKMILYFFFICLMDTVMGGLAVIVLNGIAIALFHVALAPIWIVAVAAFGLAVVRVIYKFIVKHWRVVRIDDGYLVIDIRQLSVIFEDTEEEEEE